MKIPEYVYEQLMSDFFFLDRAVFKKAIPVYLVEKLARKNPGRKREISAYASFSTASTSSGKKYYYEIARNVSGRVKKLSQLEIMGMAVHEIRHRFQTENPACLLKDDFILSRNSTADQLIKTLRSEYLQVSKNYYEKELDAVLISIVFSQTFESYESAFSSRGKVADIIKCIPERYDVLIKQLRNK